MTAADLVPIGLALLGGAVVGAVIGVALFFKSEWAGAKLRAAIATCACFGAGLGLIAVVGLPMPALA
ncbi:MAG TPA: hypothetical protein VGI95_18130, partial [Caulobacteraceae bacterium]